MVRTLESIQADLRRMLPELRERYGVEHLWICGSQARRQATATSDLDLIVQFHSRSPSLFRFVSLELEIGDRLGLTVDLVDRTALRSEIASAVWNDALAV